MAMSFAAYGAEPAQSLRPRLFEYTDGPSPLSVASVSITSSEQASDRLALREGDGYEVSIQWYVGHALQAGEFDFRLAVIGSGPVVSSSYSIDCAGWQSGEVRTSTHRFNYPRLRYSGKASLYVEWLPTNDEDPRRLWATPVHVEPVTGNSRIDRNTMRDLLSGASRSIDQAFRLGVGASIVLDVPEQDRDDLLFLGVASFTNYDNESRTGEAVAELVFRDDTGAETARIILRSGLHTSKYDHDEYLPDMLRTRKIHALKSFDSGRTSRYSDEPYQVHIYGALIPLEAGIDATTVTVRYLRNYGILHVENLAFLSKSTVPR